MRRIVLFLVLTAIAFGALATAAPAAEPKQGGSIVITYKDDVVTLDPAIGYDWQNWSMIKSIFSGLMDYEPGTTTLKPDLAESYEVSPDGLTYTFHLRKGVKFHNGRELTSADIKYSLERTCNPKTQSPGAGFFGMIDGFDAVAAGDSETLSGIATPDKYTVVFTLSRPDATFLHLMALNFSFAVPKEVVEKWGQDFGKHPVGTGAFILKEWKLGNRIQWVRYPDYHFPGLPHVDEVIFEIGQEPTVALMRLERGEVDILGDGIPPARFVRIVNDEKYKGMIVEGGQLHTGYVTMNVNMKPFDDPRVRKAVNMAINKERIVKIINNRAVVANQPLPPAMPGYAEDYAGYSFDPTAARVLMAEAGYAEGVETELWCMNVDPNPRIAQAIQQDLAAIGIRAELKNQSQGPVIAAGGEKDQAPMIWSGGMAWIADFPDPSNFYGPILGCGGAVPGGWNWAWYCNEALDARANQADAMSDPAKSEERIALWRDIFLAVMEDAPWAPVFNEQRFTMHSLRVKGKDSYFVDPVHIPINYEHVWVEE
jgi:ABC-type transport system substrate-binding protein